MINFKKAYITKIISIFIINSFVAANFIYSYPSNYSDALRVPVGEQRTKDRQEEALKAENRNQQRNPTDEQELTDRLIKRKGVEVTAGIYDEAYELLLQHFRKRAEETLEDPVDYIAYIRAIVAEEKKRGKVLIVAIDGNSGAFKTTSAGNLGKAIELSGGKAVVIERDWFIDSRTERYKKQDDELKEADVSLRDNEISLRSDKFEREVLKPLQAFNNGNEQKMTLFLSELYDKYGGELTHSKSFEIDRETIVIIEGNYLLIKEWEEYFDFRILMLAKPSIGIERRLPRDFHSDKDRIKEVFWRINTPSFISYLQQDITKLELLVITDSWNEEILPLSQKIAPSVIRESL